MRPQFSIAIIRTSGTARISIFGNGYGISNMSVKRSIAFGAMLTAKLP